MVLRGLVVVKVVDVDEKVFSCQSVDILTSDDKYKPF